MSGIGALDIVQMNLHVPRGNDAYWKLILELDKAGPWEIGHLEARSNVTTRSISQFVDRLRLAGIAVPVDMRTSGRGKPAVSYRLTTRPLDTPRLAADGSTMPEADIEILWRTIKMAKSFTPRELCDLASTNERRVGLEFTRQYVSRLCAAGVIVRWQNVKSRNEGRYRLARNLGARAPKILATRAVFDPNTNQIVGEAEAREVSR